MIRISHRGAADAILLGKTNRLGHCEICVADARPVVSIPNLARAEMVHLFRPGVNIDYTVFYITDKTRKHIQAVRIDSIATVLCENLRAKIS
jgi:hypothetical protein